MISAQELRIGNWVNYQTEEGLMLCQIDAEDIYNIARKHMASDELHSPIPLTPEILGKAGFYGSEDEYGGWVSPFADGTAIRVMVNGKREFYYLADKYSKPRYLKSFHQLQNLYFALTGEELTLNP